MNKLVDVYAKTEEGWKLVFKDIPEDIAIEIWRAGFHTGENRFSIDDKELKKYIYSKS